MNVLFGCRVFAARQARRGFTLIELLVVIAIIGILASILFPVFERAREKARAASCLSNTKQIGMAVIQYCQDYDEYLPTSVNCSPVGAACNPQLYWFQEIMPYIQNSQVFLCPDDTYSAYAVGTALNQQNISYGWNYSYTSVNCIPSNYGCGGLLLASIPRPSQSLLIADSWQNSLHYVIQYPPFEPTYSPSPVHSGGANFGFVDGHAKWYPIPGVINADITMWNMT